jgi:hypothetical protein
MWQARLRVSLCEVQPNDKLASLQIVRTRTVDVLPISSAASIVSVLERAFGCNMSAACFTARKNFVIEGRNVCPKPEYACEDAPLVAVEDVIQMAINFATDGVRFSGKYKDVVIDLQYEIDSTSNGIIRLIQKLPLCGPVGWTIDGETSVPTCTFSLMLQFAHFAAHTPSTLIQPHPLSSPAAYDGDGVHDHGTNVDAVLGENIAQPDQKLFLQPPCGRVRSK